MTKGKDAIIVLVEKLSKVFPDPEDHIITFFDVMNCLATTSDEEFNEICERSERVSKQIKEKEDKS